MQIPNSLGRPTAVCLMVAGALMATGPALDMFFVDEAMPLSEQASTSWWPPSGFLFMRFAAAPVFAMRGL